MPSSPKKEPGEPCLKEYKVEFKSEDEGSFFGFLNDADGMLLTEMPSEDDNSPLLIDPEELPFYMDLINKFNENINERLRKQAASETRRRRKVEETLKSQSWDPTFVLELSELKEDKNISGLNEPLSESNRSDPPADEPELPEEPVIDLEENTTDPSVTCVNPDIYPDPGAKLPECTSCKKIFPSVSDYKKHQHETHILEFPFKCTVCSKFFRTAVLLRQHKRYHGAKIFKCDTCGERFAFEATLKRHERVHTKEKPYVCSVCSKAFTQINGLRQHEFCHFGGEKAFQCITCGKKFTRKDSMVRHCRRANHVS